MSRLKPWMFVRAEFLHAGSAVCHKPTLWSRYHVLYDISLLKSFSLHPFSPSRNLMTENFSAICRWYRLLWNLVCGQSLTVSDNVQTSLQTHLWLSDNPYVFWQQWQWPWLCGSDWMYIQSGAVQVFVSYCCITVWITKCDWCSSDGRFMAVGIKRGHSSTSVIWSPGSLHWWTATTLVPSTSAIHENIQSTRWHALLSSLLVRDCLWHLISCRSNNALSVLFRFYHAAVCRAVFPIA